MLTDKQIDDGKKMSEFEIPELTPKEEKIIDEKWKEMQMGSFEINKPQPEILNEKEYEIIQHTLGLDNNKTAYRNNFNAGEDHGEYEILESLVKRGFMIKNKCSWIPGWIYRCTEKARNLVVVKP